MKTIGYIVVGYRDGRIVQSSSLLTRQEADRIRKGVTFSRTLDVKLARVVIN
jgi:hypothetical protein